MKRRSNIIKRLSICVGIFASTCLTSLPAIAASDIAIYPTSLTFTGQVYSVIAPQMLIVSNSGDADLNYTISSDVFWLNVGNPSGTLAAGMSTTHVINVSSRGLVAYRIYAGHLSITDPAAMNNPQLITVTLSLSSAPAPNLIVAWGYNGYGQTNVPTGLMNGVSVAAGEHHSLALRADGTVKVWGYGGSGETNVPIGLTNAVAVAAGNSHSLALRSGGTVVAWGRNQYGQTNVPSDLTNVMAVACGLYHSLALRMDGTIVGWGYNTSGQATVPVGASNMVAVAGGESYSLALHADGRVVAWGSNGNGQTNVPAGLSNVVAVACGHSHSLALRADGGVVAWGNNGNGQTNVPPGLSNVVAVACGQNHSLALRLDGVAVSWGNNGNGQTNVPFGLSNVVAVAGGGLHSLALVTTNMKALIVTSDYGSPVPSVGANWVTPGSTQACSVVASVTNGGTQYVNSGWIATGTELASGLSNNVSLVITNDSSITWLWNEANYRVNVTSTGSGAISTNSGWYVNGSTITVSITSQPGLFFGWFGDTNGCTMDGLTLSVPVTSARNLEARFEVVTQSLHVVSAHGSPVPAHGENRYRWGTTQSCSVTMMTTMGLTQYVNAGWVGSGDVPAVGSSNTVGVVITQDSSITWNWITNHWLDVTNTTGGSIDRNDGWADSTSNVVIVATPTTSPFRGWEGDTNDCTFNGTEITIPMTQARFLKAIFASSEIACSPSTLSFTGQVHSSVVGRLLLVSNAGPDALSYAVESDVFWLSVDNPGGTLGAGMSTTHVVNACTRGLAARRTYSGHLTVSGPSVNNPQQISVNLCIVSIDPPSKVVAWGQSSQQQTFLPLGLSNVVEVAAGDWFSMALRSDGTVVAWGENGAGETDIPEGLSNVISIAACGPHSLALLSNRTVVAWGDNSSGQTNVPVGVSNVVAVACGASHSMALLADGTVISWGAISTVPSGLSNVVALAAGATHSLALRADGRVIAWGDGGSGKTNVPTDLTNVVAIAGGDSHSIALLGNGHVVAWGGNNSGQTNVPSSLSNVVALAASSIRSFALLENGTVVKWSQDHESEGPVPSDLSHVIGIAAGRGHALALVPTHYLEVASTIGGVWPGAGNHAISSFQTITSTAPLYAFDGGTQYLCQGWTGSGSVPPGGTSNLVAFTMTSASTITWLWQQQAFQLRLNANGSGSINETNGWRASGSNVTVVASNDIAYTFVGWLGDTNGCVINGLEITIPMDGARTIEARFSDFAILNVTTDVLSFVGPAYATIPDQGLVISNAGDGPLSYTISSDVFWLNVSNASGVVPEGGVIINMVHVALRGLDPRRYTGHLIVSGSDTLNGQQIVPVTLDVMHPKPPTKIVAWEQGSYSVAPDVTNVPIGLTNVIAVAAGGFNGVALRSDGTITEWGEVNTWPLGSIRNFSAAPLDLTNIIAAQSGDSCPLVLRNNGTVATWGNNQGSTLNVPVDLTNVVAISRKYNSSIVLIGDGTVRGWGGYTWNSNTNVPASISNAVAVSAGGDHFLVLLANGTVVAWGSDYYDFGQTNVPPDLTNAVAVAAGAHISAALRSDGRVVVWGGYDEGEDTNVPPDLTNAVAIAIGQDSPMVLRSDGTVLEWGNSKTAPSGLVNVASIDTSFNGFSLALVPTRSLTITSAHGTPDPGLGTSSPIRDTEQTCFVAPPVADGGTQLVCIGWVGTGSVPPSGTSNSVSFTITNDSSVVWLWQTNYLLMVSTAGNGTVSSSGGWYPDGTNVVITATPDAGYAFSAWSGDTNGCTPIGAELTVPMTGARSITTTFVLRNYGLSVSSEHGIALPATGIYSAVHGTLTNISASLAVTNGGTQYMNTGWIGTGSVPASGTSNGVSFAITNDSSITWLWQTNYWLSVTNTAGGAVDSGDEWVAAGSNRTRVAAAQPGYAFLGWAGDTNGATFNGSEIAFSMDGSRSISAQFIQLTNSLVIDTDHGTASPAVGTNWIAWGTTQFCEVVPPVITNGGTVYVSVGWVGTGSLLDAEPDWGGGDEEMFGFSIAAGGQSSGGGNVTNGGGGGGFIAVPEGTPTRTGEWHQVGFVLTNDSTLTWLWATGYSLSVSATGGGSVSTNGGWYCAGTNVSLQATPDTGMQFAGWTGETNDAVITGTEIAISMNVARSIIAGFEHFTNSLVVETEHGTASPAVGTNWINIGTTQACFISPVAITNGGTQYVNRGWVGTGSVPVVGTNSTLSFTFTNQSSLTWLWRTNYLICFSNQIGGTIYGTSIWMEASESEWTNGFLVAWGYVLSHWAGDTNGCSFGVGTNHSHVWDRISFPRSRARNVWSVYVLGTQNLVVVDSRQSGQPVDGSYQLVWGTYTCSVPALIELGATQVLCNGWVGTGSVPESGSSNQVAIAVSNDSSITWQWRTNYLLSVTATNGGSVSTNSGWQMAGSNVTVAAVPAVGYGFVGWTGHTNACIFSGNQITVPMTQARSITVQFTLMAYSLTVASDYATPDPSSGVYGLDHGVTQICSAPASLMLGNTQLLCRGWIGTGSVPSKGSSNLVSFVITNDSSITWLWQAGTNQNLLLASNGGQLMSFTGQLSTANGATRLNDGLKGSTSYWKSPTNPVGAYGFVWQFTNSGPAELDRAVFYNYGQGDSGLYSKGYRLELSSDGTNFTLVTNGLLSSNEKAKTNSLSGQQARWVRLVITNGYKTKFWEFSELEVYGYPGLNAMPTGPVPPYVSITSPTNGTTVIYPFSLTIGISASDVDGVVTQVMVYGDGSGLGADITSPYEGTWNSPTPGNRQLWATAHDNEGLVSTSLTVVVVVTQQQVNLLLPANGGQLLTYTGQLSAANGAAKLADGVTGQTSFWKSPTNPVGPYGFVWRLTNAGLPQLDRVVFYNYGEGDSGRYSKNYRLEVSSDGTNYSIVTNGVLASKTKAQTNKLSSISAGWVRLVVTNGYNKKFWELSEVEVYGLIPVGGGGGGFMIEPPSETARPLARLELKNGETTLSFDAISQQLYSVDFKSSMQGDWLPIIVDQPGSSAWEVITLPATNVSGFYRIRARPAE